MTDTERIYKLRLAILLAMEVIEYQYTTREDKIDETYVKDSMKELLEVIKA